MAEHEQTLCCRCKNTNRHNCSWFDPADQQPVPGWVAEPRATYRGQQTYLVRECPNFNPMPDRKPRRRPPANPNGGFRGVSRGVRHWVARITYKGKRYYLGYFKSKEKAIAARKAAEEAIARGEEPCRK